MKPKRITEAQWAEAQAMWEQGESNSAIGRKIGVSHEYVRRRARDHGWQRATPEAEAAAAERSAMNAPARAEVERRWAIRRATEADEAGVTAQIARTAIEAAIKAKDDKLIRANSIAYGILIDKAQLLSGDATTRVAETTGMAEVLADPEATKLAAAFEERVAGIESDRRTA
jgi:C-terminal processing protease CtpA/Prc